VGQARGVGLLCHLIGRPLFLPSRSLIAIFLVSRWDIRTQNRNGESIDGRARMAEEERKKERERGRRQRCGGSNNNSGGLTLTREEKVDGVAVEVAREEAKRRRSRAPAHRCRRCCCMPRCDSHTWGVRAGGALSLSPPLDSTLDPDFFSGESFRYCVQDSLAAARRASRVSQPFK